MKPTIRVGSIVRHTSTFLKSIQWHTDVPLNGIVVAKLEFSRPLWRVWWCDRDAGDAISLLASNIELARSDATISDDMRQALLAEYADSSTETAR